MFAVVRLLGRLAVLLRLPRFFLTIEAVGVVGLGALWVLLPSAASIAIASIAIASIVIATSSLITIISTVLIIVTFPINLNAAS